MNMGQGRAAGGKIYIGGLLVLAVLGLWAGCSQRGAEQKEPVAPERKILYYRNPMNPAITSPAPKKDEMGMDYIPVYAETEPSIKPSPNAVYISPQFVQNMGVVSEEVEKRPLSRTVRASGEVVFDERRIFTVTTKVMGWVDKLYVNYTGALVRKGQPLFELYSPDLVSAESEYLQSLKYLQEMETSGSPESIRIGREMAASARRRLLNWDIPESQIAALEKSGEAKKNLTFYSPDTGFVIEKDILQGQQVMPGMPLYKIANLAEVWVMAAIYQHEFPWVKLGADAQVELSYLPGQSFAGKVAWISPTVSRETKTAQVRVQVKNTPGFELRPGMFATVIIKSTLPEPVTAVPDQAVIRSGQRNVAIIDLGRGYFEPREVTLGVSGEGYVQVLSGLSEGERIVVSSQFLIDSESNLRTALQQMGHQHGAPAPPAHEMPGMTEHGVRP